MRSLLKFLLLLIVVGAVAAIGTYFYALNYYTATGPLKSDTTVLIPKGTGFRPIINQLAEEGVISNKWIFTAIQMKDGNTHRFKAGEYLFETGITPLEVSRKLVEGDVIRHRVTIPEGLVSKDILNILASDNRLEGALPNDVPEGALLPETYEFLRGDSREELLKRMRKAMVEKLESLFPTCDSSPLSTENEFVTMASIVEKETGIAEERPRVAAVFLNRLNMNMPLQSDPTTIFGLYKETGEMKKSLTRKDLEKPSPYNTYTISGLPPLPIAHPGAKSLEAVCHPAKTKELYFVADGEGGHHFSETLDEHNRNVQKYRAWQKAQSKQD